MTQDPQQTAIDSVAVGFHPQNRRGIVHVPQQTAIDSVAVGDRLESASICPRTLSKQLSIQLLLDFVGKTYVITVEASANSYRFSCCWGGGARPVIPTLSTAFREHLGTASMPGTTALRLEVAQVIPNH